MTREEAINILKNERPHCGRKIRYTEGDICEAFDMAIKALEQEPCGEVVSKQAVLDILKDKWNTCLDANDAMQESIDTIEALNPVTPKQSCEDIAKAFQFGTALGFAEKHDEMDKVIEEVKKVVTPQPKMGHWIDKDGISDFMYCSNCGGKKHYSEKWIGCPYCLADMRGSYEEGK